MSAAISFLYFGKIHYSTYAIIIKLLCIICYCYNCYYHIILYRTVIRHCKPLDGRTNTRYCPHPSHSLNTRTFFVSLMGIFFLLEALTFLLPAIPKHFLPSGGLRHMWAGLPIRLSGETRDPTKINRTQQIRTCAAPFTYSCSP